MTSVRIQTNATEPLQAYFTNTSGAALTGLTDVFVRVRRQSDGQFLDWADSTFKAAGWATLNQSLTELDATNAPGIYGTSWDTSTVTNAVADDTYQIVPLQTPGTNAVIPNPGEIKVGQYVDELDAAVSSRAAPGDAMDLVANAVDSTSIANAAITNAKFAASAITATTLSANAITATNIATDAIGSNELAATAINEIRDSILSDSTPFAGANVDAAISSRAAPGDTMGLVAGAITSTVLATGAITSAKFAASAITSTVLATDAITADKLATDAIGSAELSAAAANKIRDTILSDATPFAGANIDATISSRAVAGDSMALTAASVDAIWDEPLAGHLIAGSTGEALNNAGAGADPSAIADAVWDESLAAHTAVGSTGEAQNRLDASILSRAAPGDDMDLVAGAVDASAIASAAITAAKFDTGAIDANAIGTAAIDADSLAANAITASAIANDAIGAAEFATGAAEKVRDTILSDATPFAGANIDAAIATRATPGDSMGLTAAAVDSVWDEPLAGHLGVGTTGEALNDASAGSSPTAIADAVWDESLAAHTIVGSSGEALARADVATSTRAVAGDAMTLSAGAIASATFAAGAVDNTAIAVNALTASKFSIGAIDSTVLAANAIGASQLATDAVNEVRDSILSDSTPFAGANVDATISSRAATGDAMALTSGGVDAIWDEPIAGHLGAGSTGEALSDASVAADPGAIADAVWDEATAAHVTSGSTGEAIGRVDVDVSTRAAPGAAMDLITDAVDADAVATTGANEVRDAILTDSTPFAGAFIDAQISSRAVVGAAMALTPGAEAQLVDATWDESAAAHVAAGSVGEQQNRLDAAVTTRAAPGAAMDLVADAVDAGAVAASGANEIRDAILSDGIAFAGANVDVATSTRAAPGDAVTLTSGERAAVADAVLDEPLAGHTTSGTLGGFIQQKLLTVARFLGLK